MKTFEEYWKEVKNNYQHSENNELIAKDAWKAGRKAEAESSFKKMCGLADEFDKAKENLSTFYKEYNNWFTEYIKSGKLKIEIK